MKKGLLNLLAVVVLSLGLFSCNNDDDNNKDSQATLNVRLTDAPGDYDAVKVDIKDVQINLGDEDKGWGSVGDVNEGVYNLLEFTAGNDTLLTSGSLPAGTYNQIRLILGDNNSVTVDGTEHDMKVPSGQQSGLKLLVNQTLENGVTYNALLDFDAARSVVAKGNGTYSLKPTIRMVFEAQSGAIQGQVQADAEGVVYAIQGQDSISTYLNEGKFLLRGVVPGQYSVVVEPDAESIYAKTTLMDNIEVVLGKTADVEANELDVKLAPVPAQ
ncbi:DUF4382 domain-containing protein [Halosquirtibacter xylanolyticus]|uniref:DUF4382 domain-containing protein n=1 Tax=Halosquirtibacter xylanolyticus TaxID=3374599 RepID=UPI00374A3E4E|nr:DUF4382 domain-containing protein [Prolixibacteraceae bacterium]